MKKELENILGKLIAESRNSGINTYIDLKDKSWIPKNPDFQQKAVLDLVDNLSDTEKEKFALVLGYFIDLSFFKLMDTLENGFRDISFNLSMSNKDADLVFAGEKSKIEISQDYWGWISENGVKGTTTW